jgi:hypothetical protein
MRLPGRDEPKKTSEYFVAAEDASRLQQEVVARIDDAVGVEWYEAGGEADLAALTLCRLRRAKAGLSGATHHGDDAVRLALEQASPEALVWIASRAISYMDESGYPEAIEPWFPDDEPLP